MADLLRPRLAPIHTNHIRNASTNTLESDSSDSSPGPLDEDTDFVMVMHSNDSSSTIGALTAMRDCEMDIDMDYLHRTSPIQKLPAELLLHVFSKLSTTRDLRSCMLVCYHWALYTVNILWHRPLCNKLQNLLIVANTLSNSQPSFPYHEMVRRLNLSAIADKVNDGTVQAFVKCKGIERLTLTSCTKLTDLGVEGLVDGARRLQALDATELESLTDRSLLRVAENCPRLQGLNITGCTSITDESLLRVAFNCNQIKRIKLNNVNRLTDESVIAIAENCPQILEIDLAQCHAISSASVTSLLTNLPHLRELRLAQCVGIDNRAFTDLRPGQKFDALRILDLTGCDGIGDEALSRLIPAAPRMRNLVLAKCRYITDLAVRAICLLSKNLHYIHLGHCQLLTDNAVIELVQQCNRIRYIDLACCSRLTDQSVRHLAKLPKLRRVGLVKCQNLTDASIIALARGPYGSGTGKSGMPAQFVSLERVHLSYCTSLTLKGITQLLLNCPRLTHLSLTGVQAFLRDDLTRFCREAPPEFTHVQRDVFCVFSGEGVVRLRDYLTRLALEERERDQEQQSAIDEPVLGPDSPDADSLSEGTADGNDHPMDFVYGPGRHGLPRLSNTRTRTRPRSLHDLPRPNFQIEMPLLPSDQMQRMGPWTPNVPGTPEVRTPLPQSRSNAFGPGAPTHFMSGSLIHEGSSPQPTPVLVVPDSQPRSRSQSRRHTLDAGDSFFVPHSSRGYYSRGSSSRDPQLETEIFSLDHMALPIFQSSFFGQAPVMPHRPEMRRGVSALRPDPEVSCFDVNHDAILSTIPSSRGPSRGPSRSVTPHISRVHSRSRMGHFLATRQISPGSARADAAGARAASGSRTRDMRRRNESNEGMLEGVTSDVDDEQVDDLRQNTRGTASSSRRSHALPLPPGLMQHMIIAPTTLIGPPDEESSERPRSEHRRGREDVDMTY